MPLPVPQTKADRKRKRAARKSGVGGTLAAGLGGLAVGMLLGAIALVFAGIKAISKIFR